MSKLLPILAVLLLFACNNDDDNFEQLIDELTPETALITNERTGTVAVVYQDLLNTLNQSGPPEVALQIDHASNAASIDQELPPARVVYFGNPEVGTPLMQANRAVGIELPLRMMVYQDDAERTLVTYRNATYLMRTYDIDRPTLEENTNQLLANLAQRENPEPFQNISYDFADNLINRTSNFEFAETVSRAKQSIADLGLNLVLEFDHAANAETVDLDLQPTTLLVFGNPTVGTQLMRDQIETGYDLPLRLLVWENDGTTFVSYYNGTDLANRYGVEDQSSAVASINNTLLAIRQAATGE